MRVQLGNEPETITDDLEKTINTVCHTCNNTWMSKVEDKNRPRFLNMMKNAPLSPRRDEDHHGMGGAQGDHA